MTNPVCHLCGLGEILTFPAYRALYRVTSDCKPWPAGGELGVCRQCGSAQAIISPQWETEVSAIYESYTIYHQSGGAEQSVFDPTTGAAATRSSRLLQRLNLDVPLPPKGRLLDIGCGNGATIRAFAAIAPDWSLAGLEVNDRYRTTVESIPGVEALYTGPLADVPGEFQIITLIHALEHIAQPARFLAEIRGKLAPDGMLVVQVPDCWQNAFMFPVADHATHFFLPTLRYLVAGNGYEIVVAADNWIQKELTAVARRGERVAASPPTIDPADSISAVRHRVEWLCRFGEDVRRLAAEEPVGIFGTSIAATWLDQELDGKTAFFVDEDPSRVGQTFMGRSIISPVEVRPGSRIVLALPPQLADQVRVRLDQQVPHVRWCVPAQYLAPSLNHQSP